MKEKAFTTWLGTIPRQTKAKQSNEVDILHGFVQCIYISNDECGVCHCCVQCYLMNLCIYLQGMSINNILTYYTSLHSLMESMNRLLMYILIKSQIVHQHFPFWLVCHLWQRLQLLLLVLLNHLLQS